MTSSDPGRPARRPRALVAALLGAVLVPLAAAPALGAQTAARSALADTSKPVLFLKETVVTGTRYPRAYFESPQSLSFVSRQQLAEQAPIVVGDVLATLPGTDSNKDSPWEQRPVIRGLSGQRVLVLMDGIPMNSVRGNGPHPGLVDPSQIERIEVVRGPTSVAYGSDALGGVINIITRQPLPAAGQRGLRGSATLDGSSAERMGGGTLTLLPQAGRLSAVLSGGYGKSGDFRSPDFDVPNSSFRDYNLLGDVRYDVTDRLVAKAGFQQYRGSDIGVAGLNQIQPGDLGLFSFPFYNRDLAHLTLEHSYPGKWLASSQARVYWQREHRDFFSRHEVQSASFYADPYLGLDPTYNPAPPGAVSVHQTQDRYFDLNTYGAQLQLTSVKTARTRFTAGLDGNSDRTRGDNVRLRTYTYQGTAGDSTGATSKRVTASVPRGRFDNYGAYVQGEVYLGPRWTVTAGGRYTHYHYATELGLSSPAAGPTPAVYFEPTNVDHDALSGSGGLVFAVTPDLHLTANVANGYREPNAQDLFFNGPGSVGFVIGNPDLKPERNVSYDLGVRWGPGNLAFSGNVYYSTFKDLIDAVPAGPGTYEYTNISTARMWGGEGEVAWTFLPQWSARSSLSTTVGDNTSRTAIQQIYFPSEPLSQVPDHIPLELVPPLKGTTSLRWTESQRRFWVEGTARYSWRTTRLPPPVGEVFQFSTFKKEWIVGDVALGAQLPTGQRVVAGVRNFTDRRYQEALSSVVDPGIAFFATVSSDF